MNLNQRKGKIFRLIEQTSKRGAALSMSKSIALHYDDNAPIDLSVSYDSNAASNQAFSLSTSAGYQDDVYAFGREDSSFVEPFSADNLGYDLSENDGPAGTPAAYDSAIYEWNRDPDLYNDNNSRQQSNSRITREEYSISTPEETSQPSAKVTLQENTIPRREEENTQSWNQFESEAATPAISDAQSFEDDIKAILAGQKLYDENSKQLSDSKSTATKAPSENPSTPSNENPHAIFDKIAKGMTHSNAFDLGTIELSNRFDELENNLKKNSSPEIKSESLSIESKKNEPTYFDALSVSQLSDLDLAEDLAMLVEAEPAETAPSTAVLDYYQESSQSPSIAHACGCGADESNQTITALNYSLGLTTPPELSELLSYLRVSYDNFSTIENKYFDKLKTLLVFHNIATPADTIDKTTFRAKVREFQSRVMNISSPDGIPGENTLWEMQRTWARANTVTYVDVPVDQYGNGYNSQKVRSDAVPAFNRLLAEVHSQGGIITSSGGFRPLSAQVTPGRSETSLHYTCIAFDLYVGSGMSNPQNQPYIITKENGRWHVWNKVSNEQFGQVRSLDAIVHSNGAESTRNVSARVIDFTEIARRHGFYDIGPRGCYPGNYMCAEWWHFQNEDVITPYISQFGTELLRKYTEAELQAAPEHIWRNRLKIYKKNWF